MSHLNIDDHKDNCCVIHGCNYGDSDCPVFTGATGKNKKRLCLVCEGTYKKDDKIVYEINTGSCRWGTKFFERLARIRGYITRNYYDYSGKKRTNVGGEVIEYRLVPIRKVSLNRYIEEYEIFKRFK